MVTIATEIAQIDELHGLVLNTAARIRELPLVDELGRPLTSLCLSRLLLLVMLRRLRRRLGFGSIQPCRASTSVCHEIDEVLAARVVVQVDHDVLSVELWLWRDHQLLLLQLLMRLLLQLLQAGFVLSEEGLTAVLDLVVNGGNHLFKLVDCLLELIFAHPHGLLLNLAHQCLVDQREQLLDQGTVLSLRLLCQH